MCGCFAAEAPRVGGVRSRATSTVAAMSERRMLVEAFGFCTNDCLQSLKSEIIFVRLKKPKIQPQIWTYTLSEPEMQDSCSQEFRLSIPKNGAIELYRPKQRCRLSLYNGIYSALLGPYTRLYIALNRRVGDDPLPPSPPSPS